VRVGRGVAIARQRHHGAIVAVWVAAVKMAIRCRRSNIVPGASCAPAAAATNSAATAAAITPTRLGAVMRSSCA